MPRVSLFSTRRERRKRACDLKCQIIIHKCRMHKIAPCFVVRSRTWREKIIKIGIDLGHQI